MNDDKIIVCRCEDIDIQTIRNLIDQGVTSLDEMKRITRCGMGPCQGKTCGPIIAREIAMKTGQSMEEILSTHSRPPFGGGLFQEVLEGIDNEE